MSSDVHGYADEVRTHLRQGLPLLVLLVALTVVIHERHWIPGFDEYFARQVAPLRSSEAAGDDLLPGRRGVHVLEVSPVARTALLEQVDPVAGATIERLQGVRPIDRAKMALLLGSLAKRMDSVRPEVIAIDIDLAPLEQGKPASQGTADCDHEHKVIDALNALRTKSDVIVIALDRADPSQQRRRNEFMVNAGCASAAVPNAVEGVRTTCGRPMEKPPHDLYFASSRLFAKEREAPMKFPGRRTGPQTTDHPEVFPSLGTLIHVLSAQAKPRRSLATALCDQALHRVATPAGNPALLEDALAVGQAGSRAAFAIDEHYDMRWFNWRLLDSPSIARSVLQGPDPGSLMAAVGDDVFKARAVILSVDAGASHDKYDLPSASGDRVSGAMLHALQAQSVWPPLRESTFVGAVIDGVIGGVFLVATAFLMPALTLVRKVLPHLSGTGLLVVPALLAVLLAFASLWAAAWTVNHDVWINPIYVILGLTAHAYVDASHANAAHHEHTPWHQSWTFGLYSLRQALKLPPGKERTARVIDAGVAVLCCWTVLILAGAYLCLSLVEHDPGVLLESGA